MAAKHGIAVTVGAWLNRDHAANDREVEGAIRLAKLNKNVTRVLVGNEVMLRGDLAFEDLVAQIERVRKAVKQPVSTAEPWNIWLENPELADHVDFIAVHMLPYWEGLEVEQSVDHVMKVMGELQAKFPGKQIVIGEVGWPSDGRTRNAAVATVSNQALFLRRFLARAQEADYVYYLMEAFDQPWKEKAEGQAGAYWGVYDADRQPKFAFTDPIVKVPNWQVLAAATVLASAVLLWLFYFHSVTLRNRGRSFLAIVVYATATLVVWIVHDFSQQYLTMSNALVGAFMLAGTLGVIAVLLAEAHEWAEAHWVTTHARLFKPQVLPDAALPKVSVHVPAFNEPAEMLIETLDGLAALDYPDFEVLVIDNNTPDEATWRPVEEHCRKLGARFRFFHVAPLAGFKAGALNYALEHTAPDAEVVAVIDSDYIVRPNWLRDLVPAFRNERTGVVQAPQDYRDAKESAFKAMCHAEYRGFFHIGMVTRNERNAIIQHGTMTLVRRSLLERIRWSEWCITEDAELGLRIFDEGYEATYIPDSYGRGVMPDSFLDFKKQRARWAFGAMQIMRRHFGLLFRGKDTRLTAGQRYHFVAGWLPWIADGLNLSHELHRARLDAGHGHVPAQHRAAADDLLGAAALAVRVQARQAAAPLPHARRRDLRADDLGGHRGSQSLAHDRRCDGQWTVPQGQAVLPHAEAREEACVRTGLRSRARGAVHDARVLVRRGRREPDSQYRRRRPHADREPGLEHLGGRAADPVDTVCGGRVRLADQHPGRFRRVDRRDGFAPAGSGYRSGGADRPATVLEPVLAASSADLPALAVESRD